MIPTPDLTLHAVIILSTLFLLTVYTAYRLFRLATPHTATQESSTVTEPGTNDPSGPYETPNDWDGDSDLRWCDDCNAFNHVEYRFCRSCTSELQHSRRIPARSVSNIQNDLDKH